MDRITKFLNKLSKKEVEAFELLLFQLQKNFTKIPGLKKLQGSKKLYRVRFSNYRIIFLVKTKKDIEIRKITKRDNNTYKNIK